MGIWHKIFSADTPVFETKNKSCSVYGQALECPHNTPQSHRHRHLQPAPIHWTPCETQNYWFNTIHLKMWLSSYVHFYSIKYDIILQTIELFKSLLNFVCAMKTKKYHLFNIVLVKFSGDASFVDFCSILTVCRPVISTCHQKHVAALLSKRKVERGY